MRKIHVTITVEDDEYVEMVDLVARSLFTGNPWIPGFIFQRAHGYGLDFEKSRPAPLSPGSTWEKVR